MELVVDLSQVDAMADLLARVPNGLAKGMERALNRAGYRMVTVTSVGVRARYTTKAAAIKERLWVTKASARAGVFESRVDPKREGFRRLSLLHFQGVRLPDLTKDGLAYIRVQVRKGGGGYLRHAFVGRQKNIKTGEPMGPAIFHRRTKGGPRLPIDKLKGPSVASQMKNTGVRARLIPEGQKILDYRLAHECKHVLREAGLLP